MKIINIRHALLFLVSIIMVFTISCISMQKEEIVPVPYINPDDPYTCSGYIKAENSPYILPYKQGDDYRLVQGNCSRYSHFGLRRYAYDFGLPVKTEIIAARGGIVLSTDMIHPDNSYSVKKSYRKSNKPKGNSVVIAHNDGTVGFYYHLMQGSAVVKPGDRVVQGEVIAQSGNSGFTTGAHLHFEVRRSKFDRQTLPVSFRNAAPVEEFELKAGNHYSAKKIPAEINY
jgi:murein DD-endopeptidase MepM/ murein hydrolase activator NlpD